jgi:hypothetical protein
MLLGYGLLACMLARAQQPSPGSLYVLLLDVSGSMESEHGVVFARYSSGQVEKLATQLLAAIRSHNAAAGLVLQPFSSSKARYAPSRPLLTAQELGAALPRSASGLETELDDALRLGARNWPSTTLFMLTDNKNDFEGNQSDRRFYEQLARDPSIQQVYFVPLAQPGQAQDALVLYAVVSRAEAAAEARAVVSDFARGVQSAVVQFRGYYRSLETLRFGHEMIQVDDEGNERPAETEGDAVVLRFGEGSPVAGMLRFRIRSSLQHWRIVDGDLRKVEATFTVPREYRNAGEFQPALQFAGSRKINVEPGGESAEVYTLPLASIADSGVVLARQGFFTRRLPDIVGRIRITAFVHVSADPTRSGLRPAIPPPVQQRMLAVRNLPEIMNEMTFQSDALNAIAGAERAVQFEEEARLRVEPDSVKNAIAYALVFGLPLALVMALVLGLRLFQSKQYVLAGPDGATRVVSLSVLHPSHFVLWRQRKVARVQRGASGWVRLRAERGFVVQPAALRKLPAPFEVRNSATQEKVLYELRPGESRSKAAARKQGA